MSEQKQYMEQHKNYILNLITVKLFKDIIYYLNLIRMSFIKPKEDPFVFLDVGFHLRMEGAPFDYIAVLQLILRRNLSR